MAWAVRRWREGEPRRGFETPRYLLFRHADKFGISRNTVPDLLAKNVGHTNCCGRARPPMPLKAHRRCLADIASFYAADAGGTSERNQDG